MYLERGNRSSWYLTCRDATWRDLPTTTKVTTDREQIRKWVKERGGRPAYVVRTGSLRIAFPGGGGEDALETVDWNRWFDVFEKNALAFSYQERTADGRPSRWNELVSRDKTDLAH